MAEERWPELLEAGTGSGKTAAAVLSWLYKRVVAPHETPKRLVFVLPMRTLVEQTVAAVRGWLDNLALGEDLEPSLHMMMGGELDVAWEGRPEASAILIGTQDQLLSRALLRGYSMSRYKWPIHFAWLHEDTLWVFDEVQLMGPGLSTSAQLQAFRHIPGLSGFRFARSLWMSATIDPRMLDTVDNAHRERTHLRVVPEEEGGRLRALAFATKRLRQADTSLQGTRAADITSCLTALAAEVAEAHQPGTLTLAVLNRVGRAQELARLLEKRGEPPLLVHSRFRAAEREALTAKLMAPGLRGIVVATQAVEAGVDISARTLFTELAPWPALVQRFGRCNRRAEFDPEGGGEIRWIELPDTDDAALPYLTDDMAHARALLAAHEDAAPGRLARGLRDEVTPTSPVLRRRDLLELFDTTADLTGQDLDVSRFIRATDERDVQLAWWEWEVGTPPPARAPAARELCRVPITQANKLAKAGPLFRWDVLGSKGQGRWVQARTLVPGQVYVTSCKTGGYSESLGWTGSKRDQPSPVSLADHGAPDADAADIWSHNAEGFVQLTRHLLDTRGQMARLLDTLELESLPRDDLLRAAHWHDVGKAHPIFQAATRALESSATPPGGPWAKAPRFGRYARPHFRHELASALAVLAEDDADDLVAYLVAAHHGKVRMSMRARPDEPAQVFTVLGVSDGDELPEVDLGDGHHVDAQTLFPSALAELGMRGDIRSWRERTEALLAAWGPFRLAYLEALVRVADWRASREPGEVL